MYVYVGFHVITSAEHLFSHVVFALLQLLALSQWAGQLPAVQQLYTQSRLHNIGSSSSGGVSVWTGGLVALALAVCMHLCYLYDIQWAGKTDCTVLYIGVLMYMCILHPTGRTSSLWNLHHTNTIISSVSEHQPTSWTGFAFDLHVLLVLTPIGQ